LSSDRRILRDPTRYLSDKSRRHAELKRTSFEREVKKEETKREREREREGKKREAARRQI